MERKTSNNGRNRRAVLKATGVTIGALAGSGVVSAKSDQEEERKRKDDIDAASGGQTVSLGGENAMSPRDLKKYAEDMADKFDDVKVQDIAPHVANDVSAMDKTPNLQKVGTVGAWNRDYKIKTPYGLKYADVENAVTLYRSDQSDDDGRWVYFAWLWSKAEPASKPYGGYWPYTWFRSDFSATNGAYVDKFSPSSRVDKHSKPISIGVTVGLGDNLPQVGVSGSTTISEGYITPDDITQGKDGGVGFKFRASGSFCRTENALNGVIHMTSDTKYEQYSSIPSDAFNWSVKGHTNGL